VHGMPGDGCSIVNLTEFEPGGTLAEMSVYGENRPLS